MGDILNVCQEVLFEDNIEGVLVSQKDSNHIKRRRSDLYNKEAFIPITITEGNDVSQNYLKNKNRNLYNDDNNRNNQINDNINDMENNLLNSISKMAQMIKSLESKNTELENDKKEIKKENEKLKKEIKIYKDTISKFRYHSNDINYDTINKKDKNDKNEHSNNTPNKNDFNINDEDKKLYKNNTLPTPDIENNENTNNFVITILTPDESESNEVSQSNKYNKLNTYNNTPSLFKKNKKNKDQSNFINKSKTNNFLSNENKQEDVKKTKTNNNKKNNKGKDEEKFPILKINTENINKTKNSLSISKTPRNAPTKKNINKSKYINILNDKNVENKKRNNNNNDNDNNNDDNNNYFNKDNDQNNNIDKNNKNDNNNDSNNNKNDNNNKDNNNNKLKKIKKENEIMNCSTFYERPRSPKHKTYNKIYTLNLDKKYDYIIEDLKNKHQKNNNNNNLSIRDKSSPNLKNEFYKYEPKINTNKTFKNTHKQLNKDEEKNTKNDKHNISNPNLPIALLNNNNNNNTNSLDQNLGRKNTKSNNEFKTFTNTEVISSFYEYTINCMEMILELDKDKQPKLTTKVDFNFPENNKKIALFDLDETLIHCTGEIKSNDTEKKYQNSIYITLPNKKRVQVGLNIRPYWKEALDMISNKYNIVIYTASHNSYADAVLNFMDPEKKYSKYRLYRSNCVQANVDGVKFYVKDLSTFDKNYNLKNIIIVDNSVLSFAYHLDNGIPIVPYYDSDEDGELLILAHYLNNIYEYDDLRIANRKHIKIEIFLNAARKELAEFSDKEEEEEDESEKKEEDVKKKDNVNENVKKDDKIINNNNEINKEKVNDDNNKDKNKKIEDVNNNNDNNKNNNDNDKNEKDNDKNKNINNNEKVKNRETKITFNSNDVIMKNNKSSKKIADITLQRRKNFLRKKTLVSFDIKKMWKDFKYEFKEKKENENIK